MSILLYSKYMTVEQSRVSNIGRVSSYYPNYCNHATLSRIVTILLDNIVGIQQSLTVAESLAIILTIVIMLLSLV